MVPRNMMATCSNPQNVITTFGNGVEQLGSGAVWLPHSENRPASITVTQLT